MRIGFITTVIYETQGRNKGPAFTRGEVYDCTREFGERWLSRNAVIELPGGKDPGDQRWVLVEKSGWTPEGGDEELAPEEVAKAEPTAEELAAAADKDAADKAAADAKAAGKGK